MTMPTGAVVKQHDVIEGIDTESNLIVLQLHSIEIKGVNWWAEEDSKTISTNCLL